MAAAAVRGAKVTPTSRAPDDAENPAAGRRSTILLVDDEPDILRSVKELLEAMIDGVRVIAVDNGEEAMVLLNQEPIDLIIADYRMPGMDGLTLLRLAKQSAPDVPRLMLTAYPRLDVATRAVEDAGIQLYLVKPIEPDELASRVESMLSRSSPPPMPHSEIDRIFRALEGR